jgi:dTDP-glucose 4,6-dehydratase
LQVALQPGELQSSALDSSLIERELGWRATVDLEAGLRQTLDWYRAAHR